jgi:hypothetical protein
MDRSEYYGVPWIRSAILNQCQDRYVCLRFPDRMQRHPGRDEREVSPGTRYSDFIELVTDAGNNPRSVQYWINRGVQEFIPEVTTKWDMDRSDFFAIDLDPKNPDFNFHQLKVATVVVQRSVVANDNIRSFLLPHFNLRFSGNRSFHLYFRLRIPRDLVWIREQVKLALDAVTSRTGVLSYRNVKDRDDYILVDIGAIARHRCVRSLWSVHHKTNRVCVPLAMEELMDFNPATATMEAVLEGQFGQRDIDSCWKVHRRREWAAEVQRGEVA